MNSAQQHLQFDQGILPNSLVTTSFLRRNRRFLKLSNLAVEARIHPNSILTAVRENYPLTRDHAVRLTAALNKHGILIFD